MTVAVSCNLADGVVLAVDSAVSIPSPAGVVKVYEDAQKLFQISERPIGVAVYGLGGIGTRTLGSYLLEFEQRDPGKKLVTAPASTVGEIANALRAFLAAAYQSEVVPELEKQSGKRLSDMQPNEIPALGFIMGGFSPGQFLSEVWDAVIPDPVGRAPIINTRDKGNFGSNWFAVYQPIQRYIKGYDPALIDQLVGYFVQKRGGTPITQQERTEILALLNGFEYLIPYGAMPLELGVQHARFLVEMVVNHHRYAAGAPVVGGRVVVGRVTYRGTRFEILDE